MDTLEVVHHVDENHHNNAIENLQAMHTVCHNKHHHIGLTHTEADKQRIADSLKRSYEEGRHAYPDVVGQKNPFYGRKHTDETKAKIRAARIAAGDTMPPEVRARVNADNLKRRRRKS
jgi:hypothetical protein